MMEEMRDEMMDGMMDEMMDEMKDEMSEKLLDVLKAIDEGIDWENEKKLIDDRILDSLAVITMITDLEEAFDVEIGAEEIIPENFNSLQDLKEMLERLQEN